MAARLTLAAVLIAVLGSMSASAAPIAIPNADFSGPANQGSLGGGVLGGSGTAPIGAGPWMGSYAGIAALLAPPVLSISPGRARISGLAVNALLLGNSGAFEQTLATNYLPSRHYVLAADIDAASLLGLNVLANGNVGLALGDGMSVHASTQTAASVALSVASSRKVHVALAYDTQPTDTGTITVSLFAHPQGIASVDLSSTVDFSNVRLTQAPIPALPPAAIAPASGAPQAATVNAQFSSPFAVAVVDAEGNPLQGVTVTFTAPTSGASASLSATSVVTDVGGRASITGNANSITGLYTVTASVDGVPQPAVFHLVNSSSGQPALTAQTSGAGGQASVNGSPFACALAVKVIAADVPAPGATVVFSAPVAGASALLSDGTQNSSQLIVTSDADGVARVTATANATAGAYGVTATVMALATGTLGSPVLLATYPLTNLAPGDRLFADSFGGCGFGL